MIQTCTGYTHVITNPLKREKMHTQKNQ